MLSQLSNLAFFYLLYASHSTFYKDVGNYHKLGDLIDQVDYAAFI